MIKQWLEHPLTRGLPLDGPGTTDLRRDIIRTKPFLRLIYEEWYDAIIARLPGEPGRVLELGSGAGFLRERLPEVITSEIFSCQAADVVLDARRLPIARGSLRAIVMTDVLHHIPDVRAFLADAADAVRPGGALVMIEPWVTTWSRFVYGRLHHEPFLPEATEWAFASTGPLSGANGALPWMVFVRDREQFTRAFPVWQVEEVRPGMPLRYLLSGGVSMRGLVPAASFAAWRRIETWMEPWMGSLAMFATIVVRRRGVDA